MTQAHEAVSRVKQPDGESQPRINIYILVSTQKITIINALDNVSFVICLDINVILDIIN
jgi:hypothetical protein